MDFIKKLGAIVNSEATEWRMLHEARQEYPNAVIGAAESCRKGLAHWGMVSLIAVCLASQGLLEGLWTVDIAQEDLVPLLVKMMAAVLVFQVIVDFAFKRLTKWRCVGYLLGVCSGVIVFAMNLDEIFLFTSHSTIVYLSNLFNVWAACICVEYMFGPMTNRWL